MPGSPGTSARPWARPSASATRAGESIRSIAEDSGRSYGFVHGVLKESGATLRGRGGATRGPRRTPADGRGRGDRRHRVARADQGEGREGEAGRQARRQGGRQGHRQGPRPRAPRTTRARRRPSPRRPARRRRADARRGEDAQRRRQTASLTATSTASGTSRCSLRSPAVSVEGVRAHGDEVVQRGRVERHRGGGGRPRPTGSRCSANVVASRSCLPGSTSSRPHAARSDRQVLGQRAHHERETVRREDPRQLGRPTGCEDAERDVDDARPDREPLPRVGDDRARGPLAPRRTPRRGRGHVEGDPASGRPSSSSPARTRSRYHPGPAPTSSTTGAGGARAARRVGERVGDQVVRAAAQEPFARGHHVRTVGVARDRAAQQVHVPLAGDVIGVALGAPQRRTLRHQRAVGSVPRGAGGAGQQVRDVGEAHLVVDVTACAARRPRPGRRTR